MKRIFFVIFFSLACALSPLMVLAHEHHHHDDESHHEEQDHDNNNDQSSGHDHDQDSDNNDNHSHDEEHHDSDENHHDDDDDNDHNQDSDHHDSDDNHDHDDDHDEDDHDSDNNGGGDQNHLPIFSGPTHVSTTVDTHVGFTLSVNDVDGDTVTTRTELPEDSTYDQITGIFSWTPSATGSSTARFFAFDGTGTSTHEVMIEVTAGHDALPDCTLNGLFGEYYNLPKTHSNVETAITGLVSGTTPLQYDWFTNQYLSFTRNDAFGVLDMPDNFFPVHDGLEDDPFYFAVHWKGSVTVPHAGRFPVTLGSDDDSWLYINGIEKLNRGGIHGFSATTTSLQLEAGTFPIDVYFAERHKTQSGIKFVLGGPDDGITFSPCTSVPPAINHLPVFQGPVTATTTVDSLLQFTLTVNDVDGDSLELTQALPQGASYATSTGMFSWTPASIGTSTATFFAFDGTGTSTHQVTIEVFSATTTQNHLPIFSGPTHVSTTVDTHVGFTLSVNDVDGDTVTTRTELPEDSTYDQITGIFSWTPSATGSSTARFFAFDGTGTSTHEVMIEVLPKTESAQPPPPPPSSTGGGGGGGGGFAGSNGPPFPLQPPDNANQIVTTGTPTQPTQGVTNTPASNSAPSQQTPNTEIPVKQTVNPTFTKPISITPTTTPAVASASAGKRSLAALLFAGLFNFFDWTLAHYCLIGWLLWILTLIAFLLYVLFSREDDGEKIIVAKTPHETLTAPIQDSTVNEYWESYQQEKE